MTRWGLLVAVVALTAGNATAQDARSALQAASALRNNIQRLRLDVAQHAPIHGRVGTHEEFLRLAEPAGRTN